MVILSGVRGYLIGILTSISLISSNVQPLYMCLLTIGMRYSYLWPIFFTKLFYFFNIELYEFCPLPRVFLSTHTDTHTHTHILTLSGVKLANVFSHSVGCHFVLLMACLTLQKHFIILFFNMECFTNVHVILPGGHANLLCITPMSYTCCQSKHWKSILAWPSLFCLFLLLFPLPEETVPKRYCWAWCRREYCLFSTRTFTASGFTFKSLNHFELIFVYGMR